eukprot:3368078-Pyramimonas_sp.AAC.1
MGAGAATASLSASAKPWPRCMIRSAMGSRPSHIVGPPRPSRRRRKLQSMSRSLSTRPNGRRG